MPKKQRIVTYLWFNDEAEEAASFYTSIFKDSKITSVTRYRESGPGPKGTVMTVAFRLEGQDFLALNGGPQFKFNEAISLFVNCESQAEVDTLWKKLSGGGGAGGSCGWLKDRYGLSWQIVPTVLMELLRDKDAETAQRAMAAMLKMKKIDIAGLEAARQSTGV